MAPSAYDSIVEPTAAAIAKATDHLKKDELVGMPTETVYGLAARAFSPTALAKVFESKSRPTFDPLIVHVAAPSKDGQQDPIQALAHEHVLAPDRLTPPQAQTARALIEAFWPGPLTLVLPKDPRVPDLATSGLDTVAIRSPAHPTAQALLREAGPLAAPSANRFGRISPTSAQDVVDELGERVSLVLDGGPCGVGVESTVVAVEPDGGLFLLRPGGLPIDRLREFAEVRISGTNASASNPSPSPGLLDSHYAPRTPLRVFPFGRCEDLLRNADLDRTGVLFYSESSASRCGLRTKPHPARTRALSKTGHPEEAARNLFAALRELDSLGLQLIVAEAPPDQDGLNHAISDRLRRASQ